MTWVEELFDYKFQSAPVFLRRENARGGCNQLQGHVSIRSRLFETGEREEVLRRIERLQFQSAPVFLRRENTDITDHRGHTGCFNPLPSF